MAALAFGLVMASLKGAGTCHGTNNLRRKVSRGSSCVTWGVYMSVYTVSTNGFKQGAWSRICGS
eukprot:12896064-Prorocentrum_lima.AAC.1